MYLNWLFIFLKILLFCSIWGLFFKFDKENKNKGFVNI